MSSRGAGGRPGLDAPKLRALSPDKPRVLVLSPDYPPAHGGIQRVVHRLVTGWTRVEARVVTPDSPQAESLDRAEPVDVRRVRTPTFLGHRAAMVMLNAAAVVEGRRFSPQVVLNAHIVTSPSAWLLARLSRAPFVQYLHGHEVADRRHLARFALSRAEAAVAVSRHTERLARASGATPKRLVRIPPGVDLPSATAAERPRRPVVVTIARLEDPYKGHDVMIRALTLVRERVPDVQWIVIGDGSLRGEYERRVREHGIERHVQFLGAVGDAERDAWLDRARVLAMPSRVPAGGGGEGFGIAYLEAAAHGVAAVAGNVGGAREAVVHGRTGLLVDPTDHIAVADAITELLLDPDRAAALGRAGAERAREFAWERIARQVEDLLLEVARR